MLKKVFKGIFIFVGIAATVLMLAVAVFFSAKLILLFDGVGEVSALDEKDDKNDTEGVGTQVESDDVRLNVLVLGKDNTSGLCDVIMIASYNLSDSSVAVLQIPRDTYAEFTDKSYKKLNGALNELGSERAFCDFLEQTLCVRIDDYVCLELDALGEIVDALGGVEVNVPCDMDYDDPAQKLSIHLKKGMTLLDGDMAEQFVRFRSGYADGDLGRIDAQKIFLAALFSRLRGELSIIEIGSVAAAVSDDVRTSISLSEAIVLAKRVITLPSDRISFVTLAGGGAIATKSGASYYVISRPCAIEIVRDMLGGDADEESFDPDRLFLNESYTEFERIYTERAEYTVYSADSLEKSGLGGE